MKFPSTMFRGLAAAVVTLAGCLSGAIAQNTAYSPGDLVLFFQNPNGATGSDKTVMVSLGNSANIFRDASVDLPSVAHIGTELQAAFGAQWWETTTLYAGAAGGNGGAALNTTLTNGDPTRTTYVTRARTGVGTAGAANSTNHSVSSDTGMTALAGGWTQINNILETKGSTAVYTSLVSESYVDDNNPFNALSGGQEAAIGGVLVGGVQQAFASGVFGNFGSGNVELALDVYRIQARNDVASQVGAADPVRSGVFVGTLTIDDAGTVGFIRSTTSTLRPLISSATSASAGLNQPFTYTTTASNSPTSFSASGLPAGLTINASSGVISGSPTQSGSFQALVTATNAQGNGTIVLTISVMAPPVISSATTATASRGNSFSYHITASNSPDSFGVTGALPVGLSVNTSTGEISGTPTEGGVFNVTVSATNLAGDGTQGLQITVTDTVPPVINSFGPFTAYANSSTTLSVDVAPSATPLSYKWFFKGKEIKGATGSTYQIAKVSAGSVGQYRVDVTNSFGTTQATESLTLLPAASVTPTTGTMDQFVTPGSGVTFGYENYTGPVGSTPIYQWLKDGKAIAGQTNPTLTLSGVGAANAGLYSLQIKNSAGTFITQSWSLTLNDTGILVYTMSGTAIETDGASEASGKLTGYFLVDRQNQNAAIIFTGGTKGAQFNRLESRTDVAAHSTGPIAGSRTVLVGSQASGIAGTEEHDLIWLSGKDSLVTVAAATKSGPILPAVTLVAPATLAGIMGVCELTGGVSIDTYNTSLALNKVETTTTYRNGETLSAAITRLRAQLNAAGFISQ